MRFLILLMMLLGFGVPAAASADAQETVQTAWRLLDYVAVDYPAAVANGRVSSASEFAEMQEFTATAAKQLASLPPSSAKNDLVAQAAALHSAVESKAPASEVAKRARALGAELLRAYPVPLAPPHTPDLAQGERLFQSNCAACHGATGHGDGPAARSLNPPPVNFTDRARASQRSVFGLEQVIDQGLTGTAMPSFSNLPVEDRWALAFKAGSFAYPQSLAADGRRIWESDPSLRAQIPNLAALAALTPKSLADRIGEQKANAVIAYLRSNPAVVQANAPTLTLVRTKLAESVAAYQRGERDEARRLALSAYLDGFEPVEPVLSARNRPLMQDIEQEMGKFRFLVAGNASPAEVVAQSNKLNDLFSRAEQALSPSASSSISTFLSALTILLREGIEALLIVIAMLAFLQKADRPRMVRFVHGGWATALAAGAATWFVATTLISVSGASRELTEGFGGIFAAFVLVFVGIWMHGKANAEAWQRYVREKVDRALSRGSGWFLFGLAFIVVYREVFETILFYAAMWEDSPAALVAGVGIGAALLGLIASVMLRYSAKLPISQFFRYSSILMAILAVVLAGKGIGAIQEAGMIGVTPVVGVPTIDALGLQPSLQVIGAQLLALLALLIGFRFSGRPRVIAGTA